MRPRHRPAGGREGRRRSGGCRALLPHVGFRFWTPLALSIRTNPGKPGGGQKFSEEPQETGAAFRSVITPPLPRPRSFTAFGRQSEKGTPMHTPRLARRRRQIGIVMAGFCLAAGSIGNTALASRGNGSDHEPPPSSNSGTTVTIEASLLV